MEVYYFFLTIKIPSDNYFDSYQLENKAVI